MPAESTLRLQRSSLSEFNKTDNRIGWIDYAKGIGIFLVVLGHVLRGLVSSSILEPSVQVQITDQWIYAFHMPLFFFISGLFIERSLFKKTLGTFVSGKLKVIVYPYFVWSILQEIIRNLTVTVSNSGSYTESIWKIAYEPILQFWFLYVLFVVSMGYAIFRKLQLPISSFILVCFLLYGCDLLNISLSSWGVVYLVQINAIYFAIGVFIKKVKALDRLSQLSTPLLLGGAVVGYFLIALAVVFGLSTVIFWISPLALVGIFSSLCLAIFLQRFSFASFLYKWGLLSLEIFVAHTIFSAGLRIILQKILNFSVPTIHVVAGTLIGIYGPIGLSLVCKKLNFPYLFRWRSLSSVRS